MLLAFSLRSKEDIEHFMQRRHIAILPILIALVVIGFKYFSAERSLVDHGKTARVGLSSQQEETLGLQSYREVLSQSDVVTSASEHDRQARGRTAGASYR
jgi:hypothetical protein